MCDNMIGIRDNTFYIGVSYSLVKTGTSNALEPKTICIFFFNIFLSGCFGTEAGILP